MLVRSKQDRTLSLALMLTVPDALSYDEIDMKKLYESVLKLLLLEYQNEARFRSPIKKRLNTSSSLNSTSNSSSASSSTTSGYLKSYRASRHMDLSDPSLPSYLIQALETHLNLIALKKKGQNLDEYTRRSLLRFYTEILDPTFKNDIVRVNKPDYLLMKFVACANKEITKLGTVPSQEVSEVVFKHADTFVTILIELIRKEKDSDALIAKLKESKEAFKPRSSVPSTSSDKAIDKGYSDVESFPKPSFRLTDMDQSLVTLVQKLFQVDLVTMQQDVFKYKDYALSKALSKDLAQVSFYLKKDLGYFNPSSFTSSEDYQKWKLAHEDSIKILLDKYDVPPHLKLISIPDLPSGYDFYILPPSGAMRSYYVNLVKLCINHSRVDSGLDIDPPIFSKLCATLLNVVGKVWRVSPMSKAVCVFTAAQMTDFMFDDSGDAKSINLEGSKKIFEFSKYVVEQGNFDWDRKDSWPIKDQEEYTQNLTLTYSHLMNALRTNLQLVFNRVSDKPVFGPYLAFLGDYIESDYMFERLNPTKSKWEKRLSKALLRASEVRYANILSNLPRDDTLNLIHILNICDTIVDDLRYLQKKYKYPLLGFLNVPKTVGSVITTMLSADAKNILKHIDNYTRSKGEFLAYSDSLEAYRVLHEIRDLNRQVSVPGTKASFKFDLETFFYPYLEQWVLESGDKIKMIVTESVRQDKFDQVDIQSDDKKFSSSVKDIFTLIKEYLSILNRLNWENEFQLARIYTTLLKNISDGVVRYANYIADKVRKELDEQSLNEAALSQASSTNSGESEDTSNKKFSAAWFDEVKNVVVNNIQGGSSKNLDFLTQPFNFKPETCTAVNNLSATMSQLTKLEDILDPELISESVNKYNPTSSKNYLSHLFSIRLVRAENLKSTNSSLQPYVTLMDTKARKMIGKSRSLKGSSNPEWDEEFEVNLVPNSNLTISLTVWDEKIGTHSICGRSLLQLDPRRFKHDGLPQEIFVDLDSQGRVLIEVAVESERDDAIFVVGRAHRTLKRCQERSVKLMVEKFSRCIHYCFSRSNLKSICGGNGQLRPTQEQIDDAMTPLYNYLNMNLQVLAEFLTKDLLLKVMVAAWSVIISAADELLLPKLSSAKTFKLNLKKASHIGGSDGSWHSAVSSAVANVTNSIGIYGFGKKLTTNEMETVFSWLNYLCFDFFHNDGNGPPIKDLKTEQYQALLLLPVYYDTETEDLKHEVERLSPAFMQSLRDRHNFEEAGTGMPQVNKLSISQNGKRKPSRYGSLYRSNTVLANATAKARARAAKEEEAAMSDPIAAQLLAEDIILRILILRDEHAFVARRLDQRERLAHTIATETLAKAAAEGRLR